jgi:flavoprotein
MHLINADGDAAEKYALSLAIDLHAGTVTVVTYQAVAIPSQCRACEKSVKHCSGDLRDRIRRFPYL